MTVQRKFNDSKPIFLVSKKLQCSDQLSQGCIVASRGQSVVVFQGEVPVEVTTIYYQDLHDCSHSRNRELGP